MGRTSDVCVGLTIGLESAVVTALSSSGGGLRVVEVGRIGFPPGTIGPGGVEKPEVVTGALRELWARARISSARKVALCLDHPGITMQLTSVPSMPDRELDAALHGVAENYGIFEGAEIVSDWALVERTDATEAPKVSVLLVAAKRQLVESILACVEAAGIQVTIADILPTAAMRVVYPAVKGPEPTAVALISDQATYIWVFQDGVLKVAYTSGVGLIGARKYGQSLAETTPTMTDTGPRLPVGLVNELRNSFRFFQMQQPQQKVSKVVLVAGGERSPEASVLSAELGVPVEARKTSDFLACEGDIVAAADTVDALGGIGAAAALSGPQDYPLTLSLAPKRPHRVIGIADGVAAAAWVAVVLVFSILVSGSLSREAGRVRAKAGEVNLAVAATQSEIGKLEQELDIRIKRNEAVKAKIEELRARRAVRLSQVISEIAARRPEGVWLESVASDAGKLVVKGKTTSEDAYANFYGLLNRSPLLQIRWSDPFSLQKERHSKLFTFEVAGRVYGTALPPAPKPSPGRQL